MRAATDFGDYGILRRCVLTEEVRVANDLSESNRPKVSVVLGVDRSLQSSLELNRNCSH